MGMKMRTSQVVSNKLECWEGPNWLMFVRLSYKSQVYIAVTKGKYKDNPLPKAGIINIWKREMSSKLTFLD
jgi:hypothetical protein